MSNDQKKHRVFIDLKIINKNNEFDCISYVMSKDEVHFVCNKKIPINSLIHVSPIKMKLKKPWECKIIWVKPALKNNIFTIGAKFSMPLSGFDFYSVRQIFKS